MKRALIAFASVAGLGLVSGTASADPGGFAPPAAVGGAPMMPQYGDPNTFLGAGGVPAGRGPDMYGWNPCFKKIFRGLPGGGCYVPGAPNYKNPLMDPSNWAAGGYGHGGPAYNPQGFPPGAYGPNGPMMQGTLAFPHQPFIRSPRDYFMVDVNK